MNMKWCANIPIYFSSKGCLLKTDKFDELQCNCDELRQITITDFWLKKAENGSQVKKNGSFFPDSQSDLR